MVGRATVDFRSFLAVAAGEQQRDSRSQFALAHLLRDFHIGGVELPIAIGLECSKDVTNNLFLPIDKLKRFTGPRAFGM